jgi:hypothetical protein
MKIENTKKITALILPAILILAVPSSVYASEMEHEGEDEHVEFAANIEFIKGHFTQAVADKEQNELELARTHAGHPIVELYELIEVPLKEQNAELNSSLKAALEQLPGKVDSLSATDFASEIASIEKMLDEAMHAVVPMSKMDESKFWIMVAIELLKTAEAEYEEGVSEGEIKEMIEYQDSQGFVLRANAIFNDIAGKIDEHEAEEIEQFFADLMEAMNNAEDPEKVETFIGGIVHEFAEVAGIEHEMTSQPSVANIKALLETLVEEYEEGEYDEAEQLAVKAYLDQYEFLEAAIEEKDPELMETTEIMLREELRALIKDRAPVEQVEEKVEAINANLDKILALGIGVEEEEEMGDPRLVYVKNIRMLLDKAVEEYEEGEYDEAMSFAIKAYLDNYEFLERDVDMANEELNEDIEHMLRDELQDKIRNRAPVSEVEALASEIHTSLDAVEMIVPEFPLGLTIVLASIVGMMVALTRIRVGLGKY